MAGISKRIRGSWVSSDYGVMKTDTDTITTLPAVLYPNDTTATVGLKGQAVQSTTPTPDSPIMPQGTGERTGNLFDYQTMALGISGYYLNSSGEEISSSPWRISDYIPCDGNIFTIGKLGGATPSICLYDANKNFITGKSYNTGGSATKEDITISSEITAKYIRFSWYTADNMGTIMLNSGSEPLPYEPYGIKIPISSANTATPVYLGEVQTTRRVKKLVLTGEEETGFYRKNTTADDNSLYYIRFAVLQSVPLNSSPLYCTHLQNLNYAPSEVVGINVAATYNVIYFNLGLDIMNAQPSGNTVAGLKEYLAAQYANGAPITLWYVLATSETAVVNEPLMCIGDYADAVNNVSIPVTAGGDTLSVDTTVQPSEVTVNYKGWHPAIVHERNNGAWT